MKIKLLKIHLKYCRFDIDYNISFSNDEIIFIENFIGKKINTKNISLQSETIESIMFRAQVHGKFISYDDFLKSNGPTYFFNLNEKDPFDKFIINGILKERLYKILSLIYKRSNQIQIASKTRSIKQNLIREENFFNNNNIDDISRYAKKHNINIMEHFKNEYDKSIIEDILE